MKGIEITAKGVMTQVNKTESCESVDMSKVKILKTLMVPEDFLSYVGDDYTKYPIIPGRIAVGKLVDVNENCAYFEKNDRVVLSSVNNCGSCVDCINGDYEKCSNFKVSGKTTSGYLKDFAVLNNSEMFPIPNVIKDDEALYIDYFATALAIIDKLNISKGEHVAVIGAGLLGTFIASLIIYYQAVPILIDTSEENLSRAKKTGIYYNLFSDSKIESEVSEITGAHMAQKVVYVADCNINTDVAIKLADHNAKIGFVGFSSSNLRVNFKLAIQKQLEFICVNNGFGYVEQAINLITNKTIDFSIFPLKTIKFEQAEQAIIKMAKDYGEDVSVLQPVIVDMM